MAVFGAPIATEDHAVRACRAALDIQTDAQHLAADVERQDHVRLQLRIGLNSGGVITGDIGSSPMSYIAVGEQVGMATSRRSNRAETTFVGRQWEMGALNGVLERAMNGNGSVVGVVGPPGIGKSRILREITSRAIAAGAEVLTTYCESHTTEVPFYVAAGLLRSTAKLDGLDDAAAREQVRARFLGADGDDLLLLDDLLGTGDPADALPRIAPDARRRRIAAMLKSAALARTTPTIYVVEDAHWIDEVSESMLAELLTVMPQTPSLVLITYRPEYAGALAHAPRSQTIALIASDSRDSQHGYAMLADLYETCMRDRYALNLAPALQLYASQRMAERGDLDGAVDLTRSAGRKRKPRSRGWQTSCLARPGS